MAEQEIDGYLGLIKGAEWHVIIARGPIAFRFGPYTALEAGALMSKGADEGCNLVITANCGREFDWDLARDMRGWPQDWKPMAEAPHDVPVIVDWGEVEIFARFDVDWGVWRKLHDDGSFGRMIEPQRWRQPTQDDLQALSRSPAESDE